MFTLSEFSQLLQGDLSILRFISRFSVGVLYLGPESAMPLATILTVIIGFLLLFWRLILKIVKKPFKFLYNKITGTKTGDENISDEQIDSQDGIQNQ